MRFALNQPRSVANVPYLLHFLGRQLKAKFLLQCKHKIQMLNRIPSLNVFRRRRGIDLVCGNSEEIRRYASNLFEYVQSCPPCISLL